MFRSIATGDTANEGYEFATDVEQQMAESSGGYVFLAVDPKNQQICVFLSAIRTNDAGYYETDVYPFSPSQGWQPKITLSDDTRDLIVSGVCSAGSSLYYIAGGRRAGTTNQFDTWQFDSGTSTTDWYATWSYVDSGVEFISKFLHKVRTKGKFTNGATVQIYAVTPDTEISVEDLENGDNPVVEFDLDASTEVMQYAVEKMRVRNALMWTVRIYGTSDDTNVDEIHEITVDLSVSGQMR